MVQVTREGSVQGLADFDNDRGLVKPPVERVALESLPIIDLSPFAKGGSAEARAEVGRQVRRACVDIGFFYLVGQIGRAHV